VEKKHHSELPSQSLDALLLTANLRPTPRRSAPAHLLTVHPTEGVVEGEGRGGVVEVQEGIAPRDIVVDPSS